MTNIAEFGHDELAQLDVALLPERETMLVSGTAHADALAEAYGFTTSASVSTATLVDNSIFYSGASSISDASATT